MDNFRTIWKYYTKHLISNYDLLYDTQMFDTKY